MIRDSLTREIEFYEAKLAEEEERERLNRLRRIPKRERQWRTPVEFPVSPEPTDRVTAVFEKHAARIAEAYNRPADLAIREKEAFAAIKRIAPLTYHDNSKITARLEEMIAKIAREDEPTAPPVVAAEPPTVTASEAFATMMRMAPFTRTQGEEGGPPMSIDPSRVRKRIVIKDDDNGE